MWHRTTPSTGLPQHSAALGLRAIVVPAWYAADGIPFGLELLGRGAEGEIGFVVYELFDAAAGGASGTLGALSLSMCTRGSAPRQVIVGPRRRLVEWRAMVPSNVVGQPDAYRYGFVGLAMLSIVVVTIVICAFVACDWMAGSVGLMSILLGLLLMRQHVVTKTNFLERIVVAFEISKQTPS